MRIDAVQPYRYYGYQSAVRNSTLNRQATPVGKALQTMAPYVSNVGQEGPVASAVSSPASQNMSYGSLLATMAPASTNFAPAAYPLSNMSDIYSFHNQYLYSAMGNTYAKIDTDGDGLWGYSELTAYADAYERATGKALDVDDLMARYSDTGDNSGHIRYTGQQQMYADDALGITHARDLYILAENNISPSGQKVRINEKALNDFVNKYTYGSPGKLYANIDQNSDGVWTIDELRGYADAYEKATGIRLDVDALFAKYDVDGNGMIKYSEQNAMYKDDALGLSKISEALTAKPEETGRPDYNLADRIKEATNSLPAATKQKLWGAFNDSMQKSAMLDAFVMTNSIMNRTYYYGYGMPYNHNSMWTAGNWAMFNMFS